MTTQDARSVEQYDVVVVGGGAAGLSGAMALARSKRSVLVVDAGQPRNASSPHAHNYLSRDGVAPGELLALGRAEVLGYGAEVRTDWARSAARTDDGGFTVELEDGTAVGARRLLVATGITDELPDVAGMRERWGRDVLHCPYCHGYEVRDQEVGILATSAFALHGARLWRQLTDRVVLLHHTAPELTADEREELDARGVTVVEGLVAALEVTGDRLTGARMADGRVVPLDALVVAPRMLAHDAVLASLGVEAQEHPMGVGTMVAADPTGLAAPGVWVAGNVANPVAQLNGAATAGTMAGAAINADLIAEEVAAAVAAHRSRGAADLVAAR